MDRKCMTEMEYCLQKTKIEDTPLIDLDLAAKVKLFFKIFANDTRLRMLHALVRQPDISVGTLADILGMKSQAISNQLQRLADKGIVASWRNGNQIHYRIVDPCAVNLLSQGICLAKCEFNDLHRSKITAAGIARLESSSASHLASLYLREALEGFGMNESDVLLGHDGTKAFARNGDILTFVTNDGKKLKWDLNKHCKV